MISLWNTDEARRCDGDPLRLRVYSSRLLGREPSLVLHGGGNTSVKVTETDLFGDPQEILYVKGSGWDLATIEPRGFAPVRLSVLHRLAGLETLSDAAMVRAQRSATTDPTAPTPSVEAILHAIIPAAFVDHTHADAVVTVSNTPDGEQRIRDIYGDRVLVVPYVMPGFALAREVRRRMEDHDLDRYEGMVLLNHGVFTWGADARSSYERMIALVTAAEEYLEREAPLPHSVETAPRPKQRSLELTLATVRRAASAALGRAMIGRLDDSTAAAEFSVLPDVTRLASRGTLTPDHVIRTKPRPVILGAEPAADIARYAAEYHAYFERLRRDGQTCLDAAPRWGILPSIGIVAMGESAADVAIVADIVSHTLPAIRRAESLGGWKPLPEAELFEMEYWELEQAKLRSRTASLPLRGKIAFVTGAASGIGRACARMLLSQGAAVAAVDINPDVTELFRRVDGLGLTVDVTDRAAVDSALRATVRRFGGLDIVVSNAGIFTPSETIEDMTEANWQRSLDLNLTAVQQLLGLSIPYLRLGIDPTIIINGSKNVLAPGPGAGAYSVAKAALTQLSRIAALELAKDGIRVNVVHPHAVFDTGAWTPEILAARAAHYGLSVDAYKRNNLLRTEVTSEDVASLMCALAGPAFARTTGAQVPVDGGSDRVV